MGAARRGPPLCSSPRCWDQAATTTVSIPPHRRDPPPFLPRTPRPQSLSPRPLRQFHLLLLAQNPGGCGCLLPRPAPCYFYCSEFVLSPRMGDMALAARCPQHPGMTCRLRFYAGASYLSCTCHSINSVCAPCPSTVCQLSVLLESSHVWLKADQTLAIEGGRRASGATYLPQAGGQGEGGTCRLSGRETTGTLLPLE